MAQLFFLTENFKMNDQVTETNATNSAPALVIQANHNPLLDTKPTKFHFKSMEDKETGLKTKRPTVEINLVVPSVEGIIEIIQTGGKSLELLQEAVESVVQSRAREIINEKEDITEDNFPYEELLWEKIANLPKAERRGGGIAKETWEEFAADYIQVMPAVTGKSAEQVANAAKIFLNKFAAVKTNKPVLKLLKDQLAIYINNSSSAESYSDCIDFLNNKADNLINMDESALIANL